MHRIAGAICGIDALQFTGDEPGGGVGGSRAAIAIDHRAEQTKLPHFFHDIGIKFFGFIGFDDAREQFILSVIARSLHDHAFFVGEEFIEEQRVFPVKVGALMHDCLFLDTVCFAIENIMSKELLNGREVILEFFPVGAFVKVSVMDTASLTEVSIQGPANASELTLKRNALKRLEYVLKKKGLIT